MGRIVGYLEQAWAASEDWLLLLMIKGELAFHISWYACLYKLTPFAILVLLFFFLKLWPTRPTGELQTRRREEEASGTGLIDWYGYYSYRVHEHGRSCEGTIQALSNFLSCCDHRLTLWIACNHLGRHWIRDSKLINWTHRNTTWWTCITLFFVTPFTGNCRSKIQEIS